MEQIYTILALLTAGVALATGAISFFIGVKKNGRTNILFAAMGFCLFIFFLVPPLGFILNDQAPYPTNILIKRVFIFSYYALIPWFVSSYTGHKSKIVPTLILVATIVTYGVMLTAAEDLAKPIWSQIAVIVFGAIFIYGLVAGIWQYKNGEQRKARWIILSMVIYGDLFIATTINQLTENGLGDQLNMKLFFPIHFHSILFMMIMGLEVVVEIFEKNRLERKLKSQDSRWQSFMQHAPLFVLELDKQGHLVYINSYAVKKLGYASADELLNKNWFHITHTQSESFRRAMFDDVINGKTTMPYFKSTLQSKQGDEIILDWVNYLTYSENGEVFGIMSVGKDITEFESTQRLVSQIKFELEKEKLPLHSTKLHSGAVIGSSEAIRYALLKAHQVAKTNAPVLLEGETGVGKEMFADLIHKTSSRSAMPLIKVNCGALPKELIEDELFGHEKGAFTSAVQSRKGRFELADGGTIFLDEIGELPLDMQPKLLRVLQNGEFEKIGGQKTTKVDVRIIAATNRDLNDEVNKGRYRDDLFYRLNVFPITIPALRKRKEDLSELIDFFIVHYTQKYGKTLDKISKADMQRMMSYNWPGNVRELMNVVERSVIASEGSVLKLDWFLDDSPTDSEDASRGSLESMEREFILKVMEECRWKINGEHGAAERLSMHPNTLRSRMKKLGINRPVKDDFAPH